MTVSPLDYRYGREEAKSIWSREGRHERQLDVERALIWAHCQLGRVSPEDYDKVAEIAVPEIVTADRVDEIERETRHDIMALTKAMAEAAGDAGSKEDLPVRGHQLPPAPGRLGGHPEANSLLQQQLSDTSASRQDDAASQPGPALLSPLQGSLPGSRQGPAGGQGDLQVLCPEAARPCRLQPMPCSLL